MMTNTVQPSMPPTARGYRLLGSGPYLMRDPLRTFIDGWREHGDIVRFRIPGPFSLYLLVHPEHVQHVLQDHHTNYPKDPRTSAKFKSFIGEGLFTSEGALWLRQRRLSQPAFHRQRIAGFGTVITECAAAMLTRWQRYAEQGTAVDVLAEMMQLTLTIVARTLFSTDVSDQAHTLAQTVTTVNGYVNTKLQSFIPVPDRLPLPAQRRFVAARRTLDSIVYQLINERRGQPQGMEEEATDLLGMLLAAQDAETGERMSDQQLRDEILTLFLAGYETTGLTLAWAFYLLSTHPLVAQRLQMELATVLGGRLPTVQDLPHLTYTQMVVEEVMRLYPAAWTIFRTPRKDDEIGGYRIPAGNQVYLSPYITHRHPAFWHNPEGFDPERFAPEQAAGRPRFAYWPFGGGPRQCIGNQLALMEARLILATVLQTYRLDLVPGHPVAYETKIFLHPRYGMKMTLAQPPRVAAAPAAHPDQAATPSDGATCQHQT